MTPAARIQTAIELLDRILAGAAAEQVLTTWARGNRFAGSSDRAAIRDHVFDALRCQRSYAARGGALNGRGLMLGALAEQGVAPETLFTGARHAPTPPSAQEQRTLAQPAAISPEVALDVPDWLAPALQRSLGADYPAVMAALRQRAPVFLRVNLARTTAAEAITALAAEGIAAGPHPLASTALEVTQNARKIQGSAAYAEGLVELQDAASQAVVEMLPLNPGDRVLDYCAGGGGKSLAMAARAPLESFAHDAEPGRMRDLPPRAARAGVAVRCLDRATARRLAPFDLVLTDVPCSGSGSWRRAPEAKWRLTAARLSELTELQAAILREAAALVRPGGWLAYATCSLLATENADQVDRFLHENKDWRLGAARRLTPLDGGDGFFCALLQHERT